MLVHSVAVYWYDKRGMSDAYRLIMLTLVEGISCPAVWLFACCRYPLVESKVRNVWVERLCGGQLALA